MDYSLPDGYILQIPKEDKIPTGWYKIKNIKDQDVNGVLCIAIMKVTGEE